MPRFHIFFQKLCIFEYFTEKQFYMEQSQRQCINYFTITYEWITQIGYTVPINLEYKCLGGY